MKKKGYHQRLFYLTGIPEAAHRYVVNSSSPIEWFIDRYYIKTDKDSGIVNDPNGWFADPRDSATAIKRPVYVSLKISYETIDNHHKLWYTLFNCFTKGLIL